uniref:DNA damage regulated autophagy modulator 1 n=1 Tax=Leptobrachium leishanense TaxID=445787 RepID=A0A8C5PYB6_9ANUR
MEFWCLKGAAALPSILVIWTSAAFITSYLISVLTGHVPPFVPYISDTGTNPPESGVFGFMISVSAMLGAATMYTRFLILQKQNSSIPIIKSWLNKVSFSIGFIACIGMWLVATFQETSVPVVHDIAAFFTFTFGVLYILLQSIISYQSCPERSKAYMCHIRIAISLLAAVAYIPMLVCVCLVGTAKGVWQPSDEGYQIHLVSAICEWIVAFGFVMYFLTYIRDFQCVSLTITMEIHHDYTEVIVDL